MEAPSPPHNKSYRNDEHAHNVLYQFSQMQIEQQHCDIKLVTTRTSILAHKLILMASSPYLQRMMKNKTAASIEVMDITAGALVQLVNYMYSSVVDLDEDNVRDLLRGAKMWQMKEVEDYCCDFLKSILNVNNYQEIRQFAMETNCPDLVTAVDAFTNPLFTAGADGED